MNKDWKKYEKLVDDICSDKSGADKPYAEHLKKWAIEIALLVNKEKQKIIRNFYKNEKRKR